MKIADLSPDIDIYSLPVEDKLQLVQESDGLLIDLLENEYVEYADFSYLDNLTHLPNGFSCRYLNLQCCNNVSSIPDDLIVENIAYLSPCLLHLSVKFNAIIDGSKFRIIFHRNEIGHARGYTLYNDEFYAHSIYY